MTKVLLLGSTGYLGEQFLKAFPDALTPRVDIGDRQAVAALLDKEKPDTVLNCAGKTGRPNVDWCETHKEETLHANVTGALVLLEECLARKIYLVHMSSGCIYEGNKGDKGFTEEDPPNYFGSFYSRTKAWSDQIMKDFPVLNLRLRMPFDGSHSERNLLMKLIKYKKVLETENSLTYLPDFLDVAKKLIAQKKTGTYNVVNEGVISPYRIMEIYKEVVDPAHQFERLTLDHLGDVTKAGRSNCILSTEKLRKQGITLRPVEEAVKEALIELKLP
ncbi:NAD-dependent epimerase/dehydratase family protein [Candidatus Peribacteria bacterium]|nr:NAD-dependent epimerase/dehydratase family protein [Candidatus Peribacteria bacterium]